MERYWPILRAIWLVFSLLRRGPSAWWGGVPKVGVVFQKLGWCSKTLRQNPHPVLLWSGWWPCGSVGWCFKHCTGTLTIYGVARGLVCGSWFDGVVFQKVAPETQPCILLPYFFFVGRRLLIALPFLRNTCRVSRRCSRHAVVIRLGHTGFFSGLGSFVNGTGRWCGLLLQCLFGFGGGIDHLRLVYPRVVSDSRVRSGYLDLVVVPQDIPRVEWHVTRHQVEPYSEHKECGGIPKCFLVAGEAIWDVNRRGNRVFDISQKLFLGVKSRPGLENIRPRLGLRSQDAQTYVRIESLRRSTPACGKPSDLSRTNVVQAPEILPLWRMASFGWKKWPCATCACLYAPDGVKTVL